MTFFFYDVETSGTNPAYQRIMQFAGQRTDDKLKPIGEPINLLVKLSEDVLPEPEAVLVHGITPQRTLEEGVSEAEFLRQFEQQVLQPATVVIGYNSIRFDDEFMRFCMWRNFHDPYEWHWKDGRSRWDLLDAVRLTRALRPDGMNWAVDKDSQPTNRLGDITAANNIKLENAHDALSDIQATIELARLLKAKQPKLFDYLLKMRDKREVAKAIGFNPDTGQLVKNQPFVYTTGRYPGEYLKTSVAIALGPVPGESNGVLVYDLRHDPRPFANLSLAELKQRLYVPRDEREQRPPLPVKRLSLNKCPAVAPLGTLDDKAWQRIGLKPATVTTNMKHLAGADGFSQLVYDTYASREQRPKRNDPDGQLYDGFLSDKDRDLIRQVRRADADKLADWHPPFIDERLVPLLLRYKARNFHSALSSQEAVLWESWRTNKLLKGLDGSLTLEQYGLKLQKLANVIKAKDKRYLLEELNLYGQSVAPAQLFA